VSDSARGVNDLEKQKKGKRYSAIEHRNKILESYYRADGCTNSYFISTGTHMSHNLARPSRVPPDRKHNITHGPQRP
jgi:hypothetical protein